MDNWVTIKTFTYSTEAMVLRGRLGADGIKCYLLDELTTQVQPFYSNAIGGIKLQVHESDVESAMAILKEGGYLEEQRPPSPTVQKFDRITSKLPGLENLPLVVRFIIVLAIVLGVALGILAYSVQP